MIKINPSLEDQTLFSAYVSIGLGVATVGLSYLIFRCLTAPKEEALSQKQHKKAFVICPKTGSYEDLTFAKRVIQAIRKVFPENAQILLQATNDLTQEAVDARLRGSFLDEIEVAGYPINLSHIPFQEAKSTYILHDSILNVQDPYPFSEDQIVDIGKDFPVQEMRKNGIYCLEEENISDRFKDPCLRNYSSIFPQKALYEEIAEIRSDYQDWDPLLFLVHAALSAQEKKLFNLYVPGRQFLSATILSIFLESLLETIEKHPQKPGKVQVFVPTSLAYMLQDVINNNPKRFVGKMEVCDTLLHLSCLTFSSVGSLTDKTMRLFFLGDISEEDRQKLHWDVQNQIRNISFDPLDMSFSEWLSCKTEDLDDLIGIARDYNLPGVKGFLEDFRRDIPRAFSFESCQKFAEAWMNKGLQQEAQILRKILKKESNSNLWLQQKLSEIR